MREASQKPVLDPCCGSRMFYFDKQAPYVQYNDNRKVDTTLCDGRPLHVNPDDITDVTSLPYADETFHLIVFDPPHLKRAGDTGWQAIKYGKLPDDWRDWMTRAFNECWRCLAPCGTLVFKWYEYRISLSEVLKCAPVAPLFGNKRPANSKTHWLVFFKEGDQ